MLYELIHLDTPNPKPSLHTAVLNNSGVAAGGWPDAAGNFEGVFWDPSDGSIKSELKTFGLCSVNVNALNDEDEALLSIVPAGSPAFGPSKPAVIHAGKVTDFTALFPDACFPTDINNAGWICGTIGKSGLVWPFRFDARTPGKPEWLPLLPGAVEGMAGAIADSGAVVGECIFPDGTRQGCLWSMTSDVRSLGLSIGPTGINAKGQVVATRSTPHLNSYEPGILDVSTAAPTWHPVPLPPGTIGAMANDINNFGHVVGYAFTPEHNIQAFVYREGVSVKLSSLIPGETENYGFASAINDGGVVSATRAGRPILVAPVAKKRLADDLITAILQTIWVDGSNSGEDWCRTGPRHLHLPGGRVIQIPVLVPQPPLPPGPLARLSAELKHALLGVALHALAPLARDRSLEEMLRKAAVELAEKALHSTSKDRV